MLRADRGTEPGPERLATRGRRVVRAANDAINETERRICGSGAVSRPAVAEGLALAGRRAATLLVPGTAGRTGSHTASVRAAWVHHRTGSGASSGFAFELSGSIAQDVVDQCLVAHDLARRIGRPGLCTFEPPGAGRLDPVRLPDEAMLLEFDAAPVTGEEDVPAAAARAFEHVAALTGRPIAALTVEGAGNAEHAEHAVIACGAARPAAERLARALEGEGLPCRIVCIHLVRPFPVAALTAAVAGLKGSVLIPAGDGVLEAAGGMAPTVLPAGADFDHVLDAARQAFGLESKPDRESQPDRAAAAVGWTARPAGDWAGRFLLDAAARLPTLDEVALDASDSTLVVGPRGSDPAPHGPACATDVALCAHPSYVEDPGLLQAIVRGGRLIIVSAAAFPDTWWDDLQHETRLAILDRELCVNWIDLGTADLDLADPDAVREFMLDGFLSAKGLRLEPPALESSRLARESDFLPTVTRLPGMPEETSTDDGAGWRDAARHFHLTGNGAHSATEPTGVEPLHPLVLDAMDAPARQGSRYPLFIDDVAVAFESRVSAILEQFEAERAPATILGRHLPRLSSTVGRVLSRDSAPATADALLRQALDEFERGFDLSDAAMTTLRAEGERLRERLESAAGSAIVGLDETTLPYLHAEAVRRVRRERRGRLLEEIDALVQRLKELLAIDRSHDTAEMSAEALESTFGADAADLFDPQKLAANLPRHRGSVRLDAQRRGRIETTLETLRTMRESDHDVDLIVVQPDPDFPAAGLPGARIVVHPRGLGAAIGLFDGIAARYTDLFRALRVARLEVDGAYDPELHDAPLARFDWQGMHEDELLSLPRLVVLETAERLRGAGLGAFAELLRSGRPVHVLVEQSTSEFRAAEAWQGLAGFHPGLGYVAVAHREAFVVESSLVCPERLARDLGRMASSLRPGAALVAVPVWQAAVPAWVQLVAAEQGRAVPCFTYDPEAGQHWAERFDLQGNPQPERPWPLHTTRYLDAQGLEQTLEQPFTFAHAVALDPAYRGHFRIVPGAAWSAEQIELGEYLGAPAAAVERRIPFIWVVTDGGRLSRALITRELAHASRDRLRAWRILQELAGTDNEYARRAAETARVETLGEAETARATLETEHAAEVERVRTEAAGEAMDRLARVLMDLDAVPLPAERTAPEPVLPAEPAVAEEDDTTAEVEVEEEDDDVSFDDAYVNSALCTSCQECININPRLFKYDANKQAFITDPSQGTYDELVRSAEKCPARCIHPGLPAAGDTTANPGLIERAAKFK